MSYSLTTRKAFQQDLSKISDQVTLEKIITCIRKLKDDPYRSGVAKLRIPRFQGALRWRCADKYRIVYKVNVTDYCVDLLVCVRRDDRTYKHLTIPEGPSYPYTIEETETKSDDIANSFDPGDNLPEIDLTDDAEESSESHEDESDIPLNIPTTIQTLPDFYLDLWGVPKKYWPEIQACRNSEDLLELSIPEEYVSKLLDITDPSNIQERVTQPAYEVNNISDLTKHSDGTLSGFLLKLDPDQKRAANRNLVGPALVRGGAGTGKSIVAMYRIRDILAAPEQGDMFRTGPPRLLYLTFTNTLTNASRELLQKLIGKTAMKTVTVATIDSIARQITKLNPSPLTTEQREHLLEQAKNSFYKEHEELERIAWKNSYLFDEFDWIIEGEKISSELEYLEINRTGRGTPINKEGRKVVWALYLKWLSLLRKDKLVTFTQNQRIAVMQLEEERKDDKYDFVVLDEAQDLTPVGIELALNLCLDEKGFFMTADDRQSIYRRGFSWNRIDERIDFRGRSVVLKKNYRSTKPIEGLASSFLQKHDLEDTETSSQAIQNGPLPICTNSQPSEAAVIVKYFREWAKELKVPLYMGAVLVRTQRYGRKLADSLCEAGIKSEFYEPRYFQLDSAKVKVITMHSSKGIEFPMVAIAGANANEIPALYYSQDEEDKSELLNQERRLFHVSITRAMKRLLITYSSNNASTFIQDLNPQFIEKFTQVR